MSIYSLDGKPPDIASTAWIADTATVLGNVHLGADVGIWFGAVLRGDNELISVGNRSNIQDNCVLHTDIGFPLTIAEDCTIGHTAILHGCTIGQGALIGMGATVLNGAQIGAGSIVGANALIPEGKIIPENSLVIGAPGKVVKELPAETAQMLMASAAHYVENAKRFRDGLKLIS
jgi:carbonic anhydrase/acetyltransferase-like protein (isoleucine patch superfamily)